jgi:Ca2+-binding EF-hand superfamily protein
MIDNEIFEQDLLNRLNFYDNQGSGFIDQTEFKNVLGEIGVILTLSELIKIVKIFPINSMNQINYK